MSVGTRQVFLVMPWETQLHWMMTASYPTPFPWWTLQNLPQKTEGRGSPEQLPRLLTWEVFFCCQICQLDTCSPFLHICFRLCLSWGKPVEVSCAEESRDPLTTGDFLRELGLEGTATPTFFWCIEWRFLSHLGPQQRALSIILFYTLGCWACSSLLALKCLTKSKEFSVWKLYSPAFG